MLVSSSRSHCSKLKCYTILQRSTASNEFNFIQHSQHYHPAVTVRTMLHFHLLSKFQFYCSEKSSNCKLSDGVNANFHWKLLLFIYSGFPSSFNKIWGAQHKFNFKSNLSTPTIYYRHDILFLRKLDEVKLIIQHIKSNWESHHSPWPCCCHYPLSWSLLWCPLAPALPSHRCKVAISVDRPRCNRVPDHGGTSGTLSQLS